MFIQMQTIITSTIDVDTLDVTHAVVIEAGEASVLGTPGVKAVALGAVKSALAALEAEDEKSSETTDDSWYNEDAHKED